MSGVHLLGAIAFVAGCVAAIVALAVATWGTTVGRWTLSSFEGGQGFRRWFFSGIGLAVLGAVLLTR